MCDDFYCTSYMSDPVHVIFCCKTGIVGWTWTTKVRCWLVVHRSSETSTNQSDVIIRSDNRFLNLVVDSDSIVSKIYMLNFVLWWLVFFLSPYWQKYCSFIPAGFFCPHTDKHLAVLSKRTFDNSVNTHFWTSLLFIYFPE